MDSKTWWMIEHTPKGESYRFTPWGRCLSEAFSYVTESAIIRKIWIKDPDKGVMCVAETQEDVQRLFE